MRKSTVFSSVMIAGIMLSQSAYAATVSESPIYLNDSLTEFSNPALIENGTTIVPVRELSEKAGFKIAWNQQTKKVYAFNDNLRLTMTIGDNKMQVLNSANEIKEIDMLLPPEIINSVTYVPLRSISESFGADVVWNAQNNSVYIYMSDVADAVGSAARASNDVLAEYNEQMLANVTDNSHTFYSQYDQSYIDAYSSSYGWTAGRNGYCYVVSYAMLLSDLTGNTITPKDIADINIAAGGSPKICYHGSIVSTYGKKFVPAIDTSSPYYKGYDTMRGLTNIDNSSSDKVVAALKEALDRHPKGVLVRDNSMPHTMVAIGYEGDTIFFNDPALQTGNSTWGETCLKKRDITTISAIGAIE